MNHEWPGAAIRSLLEIATKRYRQNIVNFLRVAIFHNTSERMPLVLPDGNVSSMWRNVLATKTTLPPS